MQTIVDIVKPKLDTREYKVLKLVNELEVLLVSDSESQTSAAAMDVKVGHFSDPADFPGVSYYEIRSLFKFYIVGSLL